MRYFFLLFFLTFFACNTEPAKKNPPNIVLIIADDMGFSDLSYFGGEIPTPNIDALFDQGVTLNQFYVSPSCAPTRAMLLSGADSHKVGMGSQIESIAPWQKGKEGYEGHLQSRVVTFADVLKDNGYNNYLTGKWHMGIELGQYPIDRGFTKSFAMLNGSSFHNGELMPMPDLFKMNIDPQINHVENGKEIDFPKDQYSSDYYTDKMIEYIDGDRNDHKPFLAYLSLIAPHFPLQAPKKYIEKYKGKYDQGYRAIAEKRLDGAKRRGLIDPNTPLDQITKIKDWDSITDAVQKYEARKMEVYAAMIDNMDENVGKLVDYLKREGEYENTVIMFFADNGPSPNAIENLPQQFAVDNSIENLGARSSFVGLGPGWGPVSSIPFKGSKGTALEGGIRGAAAIKLAHHSDLKETNAMIHITDVYPTLLDIGGVELPTFENGQTITGKSFLPILENEQQSIRSEFGMELTFGFANTRLFRKGDFKLVWVAPPPLPGTPPQPGKWKLFNIANDPIESNDLSGTQKEKFNELKNDYNQYVAENGVILPPQKKQMKRK